MLADEEGQLDAFSSLQYLAPDSSLVNQTEHLRLLKANSEVPPTNWLSRTLLPLPGIHLLLTFFGELVLVVLI